MRRIPYFVGNVGGTGATGPTGANGYARDRVPGVITQGPVTSPVYPDWTLDQMMRTMWRVKTWHVSGGFEIKVKFTFNFSSPPFHPTSTFTGTMHDHDLTWVAGVALTDEVAPIYNVFNWYSPSHTYDALILGMNSIATTNLSAFTYTNTYTDFGPPDPVSNTEFGPELGFAPAAPIFPSAAGVPTFKMPVPITGYSAQVIYGGTPPPGGLWNFNAAVSVQGVYPTALGANLTWDGIVYPLYYDFGYNYDHTFSPTPPTVTITFTGSIDVVATEYWPYENRLSQAVYDTSSGAVNNDPFA